MRIAAALTFVLLGCGPDLAVDCATDTPQSFVELTGFEKCTDCHSSALAPSERKAAPEGIDYDTYELAKQDLGELIEVLEDGSMPPEDDPQLTDAELKALLVWAKCGAPE